MSLLSLSCQFSDFSYCDLESSQTLNDGAIMERAAAAAEAGEEEGKEGGEEGGEGGKRERREKDERELR
jgi:hypothetical protein